VTLQAATGASITYNISLDGGNTWGPSLNYTITNPPALPTNIPVTVTTTIRAYASETGFATSDAGVATYTITGVPDLTITSVHTGNFTQGQTGAAYAITVSNVGSAPTSGTVTVSDALPAGLVATNMAGNGWTCGLSSCTRSDALQAGNSYPVINLTVSVSATAPANVTNTATVSGGGETNVANDTANDPTTITGFTISLTSSSPTVLPGDTVGSASFNIAVSTANGANLNVAFAVSGYPVGSTATFSPGTVPAPGPTTLTIQVPWNTAAQNYPLIISATAGMTTRIIQAVLTVQDYNITVSPPSQSVGCSGSVSYQLQVNSLNGFAGSVTVTAASIAFVYNVSINGNSTAVLSVSGSNPSATAPLAVSTVEGTNCAPLANTNIPVNAKYTASAVSSFTRTATALLGINTGASTVSSVAVSPYPTIASGAPATVTVYLTSPAPAGGIPIGLTSSNTSAFPNAALSIPQGSTSGSITLTARTVNTSQQVILTASYSSSSQVTFAVTPPAQYTLTTVVSPPATGTVTPSSGSYGGSVTLTATPNTGYQFTGFNANGIEYSTSPATIPMTAPATVTAMFAPASVTPLLLADGAPQPTVLANNQAVPVVYQFRQGDPTLLDSCTTNDPNVTAQLGPVDPNTNSITINLTATPSATNSPVPLSCHWTCPGGVGGIAPPPIKVQPAPVIDYVEQPSPLYAGVEGVILIYGSNFGNTPGNLTFCAAGTDPCVLPDWHVVPCNLPPSGTLCTNLTFDTWTDTGTEHGGFIQARVTLSKGYEYWLNWQVIVTAGAYALVSESRGDFEVTPDPTCAVPANYQQNGQGQDMGPNATYLNTGLPTVELRFSYTFESSTHQLGDLLTSGCTIGEHVTYTGPGLSPKGQSYTPISPPFPSNQYMTVPNPTVNMYTMDRLLVPGALQDNHDTPGAFVPPYTSNANYVSNQTYQYSCPCWNNGAVVTLPTVPPVLPINHALTPNGDGTWRYAVCKPNITPLTGTSCANKNPLP